MKYLSTQIMVSLRVAYNNISKMPACEDRKELIKAFLEYARALKPLENEEIKTNTRLNYLYRDASNWKTCNSVILSGKMTDEQFAEMKDCCEDGHEMFVPEQVGLDLIRNWETTADDHPYCELEDYEYVNDKPTTDMTIEELLEEFRSARDNWHPEKYEPEIEEEDEENE